MTPTILPCDREAAASYYYSAGGSPNITRDILEGKKDGWFRVQAFAAHREAETARIVAWLRAQTPDDVVEWGIVNMLAAAIERGEQLTIAK